MKKSAIALAVAGVLSVPVVAQADTTFYGSLRTSVVWVDPVELVFDENGNLIDVRDGDDFFDVADHSSRWGVRGSEDLGNGLSAIYQIETRVESDFHNGNDFSGRLAWVGLKGGFGAVKIGTQWSPYYNVAGRTDVFNASGFVYYLGPFRLNDSLVYETPDSLSFMKGEAMINMDGPAGEDSIDQFNVGANFNIGPVGAGVAYLQVQEEATGTNNDLDFLVVAASVDFAGASIAAEWEHVGDINIDDDEDDDTDVNRYQVVGQYTFGNNIVRAGWERFDPDAGEELDAFAVGFQHNLSKRTRVWVEYQDVEILDSESTQQVSVGMRHDF